MSNVMHYRHNWFKISMIIQKHTDDIGEAVKGGDEDGRNPHLIKHKPKNE